MIRWSSRAALGLVAGVLAAAGSGCAQSSPPINRVQPNVLSKSFFIGEKFADPSDDPQFYWRGYVIDNSATQSLISVGTWTHVDRIRWELNETSLIAHKAYQLVEGADARGLDKPDGVIVAKFKIEKHFDVRRAYTASTGEEQNIVEENDTDRPWYEREYMRVDWSSNEVVDPMWNEVFTGKFTGSVKMSALKYTVTDPNSELAPHFEEKDGYFDIVNRYYVEPANMDIWGIQLPTCLLTGIFTGSATYECDSQEASVRFSFMRIKDDDFEPLENTRAKLDVVGNPGGLGNGFSVGVVTSGRQGFDPAYGYVDKNFHAFANVHNIWQKSHIDAACDTKADADKNGTDDQCEPSVTHYSGSSGSQCDIFVKKCTIPYRDRQVKTVGYWVNPEMPAELQDPLDQNGQPTARGASEDIVYSWNQLMRTSVGYAREVECRRTGGDRDACHAQFFASDATPSSKEMVSYGGWLVDAPLDKSDVLTLCHNPVRPYDNSLCGEQGSRARTGDLRKNMMVYWPYDTRAMYGGIADWNGDPLTGQIIGGMALTAGRSATYGAAFARDVLQVAMGDTTVTDLTDGVPSETYADRLKNGVPGLVLSDAELQKRVASVDAVHAAQTMQSGPLAGQTASEKFSSFLSARGERSIDQAAENAAVAIFDATAAPARGSRYEADAVGSQWLVDALGMSPSTVKTDGILETASPLRGLSSIKRRILNDTFRTHLESRGACFLDNDAAFVGSVNLPGLAKFFKDRYASNADGSDMSAEDRGKAIYRDLWVESYKGIELHEVGHSLGMLHEFASSWDSPNYNPQYWQLRTNEGQATAACDGKPRTNTNGGDSCMGPRYLDPETADEQGRADESRPGINYFASTSTMEYQSERFGESVGLGSYDLHAMKALYGRVLETMDARVTGLDEQPNFAHRMRSQLNEQDAIVRTTSFGTGVQPVHYTELARAMKRFDPTRDCRDATNDEKIHAQWRIVHGKVCAPTPKDHAAWQDFTSEAIDPNDPGTIAPVWHVGANAPASAGAVRWFYRWGSTNNAYVHTNPSDQGADIYEVATETQKKFDAMYPFSYFRRQNREYAQWSLPSRTADVYFERMRSYHYDIAARTAMLRSGNSQADYAQMAASDDWQRPYLVANTDIFNFFQKAILMPQPGDYYESGTRTVGGWSTRTIFDQSDTAPMGGFGTSTPKSFSLDIGNARFIDDQFDSGPTGGGSWRYLDWMKRAGFEVEKGLAISALTETLPPVFVYSRNVSLDPRATFLNFYADMPQALDRLLGGIMSEDWEAVSLSVVPGDNKQSATPQVLDLTDVVNAPVRPAKSQVVFGNLGYRQQILGAMLAAIYSRAASDMTLINKMRVWVDGIDGKISTGVFPKDAPRVTFYNPASRFKYVAGSYGSEMIDGKLVDRGIASRMLQYANALLVQTYNVERDANNAPVLDANGSPKLILDANGDPALIDVDVTKTSLAQLTRYVGLLDGMRQLGLWYGNGPL